MSHLQGVLTLVNSSGPWFRIQGRHLRDPAARRFAVHLSLSQDSGIVVDFHAGEALWIRLGWYPAHAGCGRIDAHHRHHCWARWLRTADYGTV